MTPERYRRLGELFDAALDRPAAERASFLEQACQGDNELRSAVQGLLENYVESDPFLAPPGATSR
jgi:serine/threonine-protein kinase